MSTFGRWILALFGIGILVLAGATACVVTTSGSGIFPWTDEYPGHADRTDIQALSIANGRGLAIDLDVGEIHVRASDAESPSVHATIHARGHTDEEARARLAGAKIAIEDGSGSVRVRLIRGESESERERQSLLSVDLEVTVPSKTGLALTTGSGAIRADGGEFSSVKAESRYGEVAITGVQGDLWAKSSSGRVVAANIHGKTIDVSSGYGSLELADLEADDVHAETRSGSIEAQRVRAPRIRLDSGYGALSLKDIEGELEAKSSSGRVEASNLKGSRFTLASRYGSIEVRRARGELSVDTASGHIDIADAEGALTAKTRYGSIEIAGVLTRLDAESSSGHIAIRAATGSSMETDWRAVSRYGKIDVELPKSLAFNLAAKTAYGQVNLGFPIEIPAGGAQNGRETRGKINGGGREFTIEASSGNVNVQPAGANR